MLVHGLVVTILELLPPDIILPVSEAVQPFASKRLKSFGIGVSDPSSQKR